jgi:hypothetical protein
MSHTKRIVFWIILLIGSAVLFYFWATNQMFMIQKEESTYIEPLMVVSAIHEEVQNTPEFYVISTSSTIQILMQKDLDLKEWSSSTLKMSSTTIDSTDFSFIFPNKNNDLYQNCTYKVELDLGDTLKPNYIGVLLVDLGTQKEVKAKDSGLMYSLTFKDQKFLWSVGNVWPGEYYLSIPIIDGKDVVVKSERFSIEEKPEGYVCEK